jgi:ABC-2 type transport system permease protein
MTDLAADGARAIRVVDAPLLPPSDNQGLLSVFRRRYLLKLLVQREVAARYQGSVLGLLWSYINPLSQFFIYWFVIGHVIGAHKGVENYAVHVFSAFVVVHFFIETFQAGTRSIVRNKSLVQKMAVPREMFPVASMLVSLYHVVPQMVILVAACLFTGWTPDFGSIVATVLALLIIMVLGTALALLFSVANVYFRDFGSAVNILTNFVRFGVPMIYTYESIKDRFGHFLFLVEWEPIADAVLLMQRAFWVGTTAHPEQTLTDSMPSYLIWRGVVVLAASVIALVLAQLAFSKLEKRIPESLN